MPHITLRPEVLWSLRLVTHDAWRQSFGDVPVVFSGGVPPSRVTTSSFAWYDWRSLIQSLVPPVRRLDFERRIGDEEVRIDKAVSVGRRHIPDIMLSPEEMRAYDEKPYYDERDQFGMPKPKPWMRSAFVPPREYHLMPPGERPPSYNATILSGSRRNRAMIEEIHRADAVRKQMSIPLSGMVAALSWDILSNPANVYPKILQYLTGEGPSPGPREFGTRLGQAWDSWVL